MPYADSALSSDAEAVLAVTKLEMYAMSRWDTQLYWSILAEDAVFLPPSTSAKWGKELRDWLKGFLNEYAVEWLETVDGETAVMGDMAYHDYAYSMRSTPRGRGEPVIGHGKGLHVLRREKDGWKIVRNVWNATPLPIEGEFAAR